jgi:hypothetical protein
MGRQQSAHPFQLDRANGPALHDQMLFHAPPLQTPPNRVPPKIKLFFACLQALRNPHTACWLTGKPGIGTFFESQRMVFAIQS